MPNNPIVFRDLREHEAAIIQKLLDNKTLTPEQKSTLDKEKKELLELRQIENPTEEQTNKLKALIQSTKVNDPLFVTILSVLGLQGSDLHHVDGLFPSQQASTSKVLSAEEKQVAAIYGILTQKGYKTPPAKPSIVGNAAIVRGNVSIVGNSLVGASPRQFPGLFVRPDKYEEFAQNVRKAQGTYDARKSLFDAVLKELFKQCQKDNEITINSNEWAEIVDQLVSMGVDETNEHLSTHVNSVLARLTGGGIEEAPSTIEIDLPDLEERTDVEIQEQNLHAVQAIYFSAMLEELRLFQVVEKLVELFQMGMLPFGRGYAGDYLYNYWKRSSERISEGERRNLYARVFGFPDGEARQNNPNREFNDLWLRFVSAVSAYSRQYTISNLIRPDSPIGISQEHVRKAGRDLAANLSLHGYGIAYFVATDLQEQIKDHMGLLSHPDVMNAYGARDLWQVVEQVSTLELGGTRNSVRYRTMAQTGAVVIRWLATHKKVLSSSSFTDPVINMENVLKGIHTRQPGEKATNNPDDVDLVNACEQWLAVTGTPDDRVEQYSQPIEGPNIASRPIQIPAAARDLLESVGVQAGYKNGQRY